MKKDIEKIIRVTDAQASFWKKAHGWAPVTAADLLSKSRLDRHCSLARTLKDYMKKPTPEETDGRLILAYATLRALCEGTIKLTFSVWYDDYQKDVDSLKKKGKLIDPDGASFDPLIALYGKKFTQAWTPMFRKIQERGNAIHAFKDRPLGSYTELQETIVEYCQFLIDADSRLPYPEGASMPGDV
jgi:hypothetical protein